MITNKLLIVVSVFVLSLNTITPEVIAQKGWYLGGKDGYDRMQFDLADERRNGNNYEIDFGHNFNDSFGAFFTVGGSVFDGSDSRMGFIEFGPRFVLWKGPKLQPYLDLMAKAASVDNGAFNFSQTGFGGSMTLGAHYFLNSGIAINSSVSVSRVNFNDVKFAGIEVEGLDDIATNVRLRVGLSFFFR
jgi:hypothetical protein